LVTRIARYLPPRKDAQGKRICRFCGAPCINQRRYHCSEACAQEYWAQRSPAAMRHFVGRRDKGLCAVCHLDTRAFAEMFNDCFLTYENAGWRILRPLLKLPWSVCHTRNHWDQDLLSNRTFPKSSLEIAADRLWEADHIVPIVEGGSLASINVRTLCWWCHRDETRALHRRRRKQTELPIAPAPRRVR